MDTLKVIQSILNYNINVPVSDQNILLLMYTSLLIEYSINDNFCNSISAKLHINSEENNDDKSLRSNNFNKYLIIFSNIDKLTKKKTIFKGNNIFDNIKYIIYLNEKLTQRFCEGLPSENLLLTSVNDIIYYKTRLLNKSNNMSTTWIYKGCIYKKYLNHTIHKIKDMNQI